MKYLGRFASDCLTLLEQKLCLNISRHLSFFRMQSKRTNSCPQQGVSEGYEPRFGLRSLQNTKLFESSSEKGTSSNAFLQAGIHRLYLLQTTSRVGSRTQCPSAMSGLSLHLQVSWFLQKSVLLIAQQLRRQGMGFDLEDPAKPTTGTDSLCSDIPCKARSESKGGFFLYQKIYLCHVVVPLPSADKPAFPIGCRRQQSKGD